MSHTFLSEQLVLGS